MKPGYECEVIEPSQKTKNKVTLYHFAISWLSVPVYTETGSLPVSILPVVMSYVLRICTLSAVEFFDGFKEKTTVEFCVIFFHKPTLTAAQMAASLNISMI